MTGRPATLSRLALVAGDILLANTGVAIAFLLRFQGLPPDYNWDAYLRLAPWLSGLTVAVLAAYDLYEERWRPVRDLRRRLLLGLGLMFALLLVAGFLLADIGLPRSVYLLAALLELPLFYAWRRFYQERRFGQRPTRVIQVSPDGHRGPIVAPAELGPHPRFTELPAAAAEGAPGRADVLLLAGDLAQSLREHLFIEALARGIPCYWQPSVYDGLVAQARLTVLGERPYLALAPVALPWTRTWGKRLFDLLLGSALLVATLPLMVLIAVAVVADSGWPPFYTQERVTDGHRIFRLWKFRTLMQDWEARQGGPRLTAADGQGVTRVGRWLRHSHLDELPQLWNVVRGDMSLVGPRPERPVFVDDFRRRTPAYDLRHHVRAGVTGLAQVGGHYFSTPEEKLQMDLAYARRPSLWQDVRILLHTLEQLFHRTPRTPEQQRSSSTR
ncbi:MAG: sugar transferase [Firmicutes bacterium]|nr:sugar transferase [Bacillota bacterium]